MAQFENNSFILRPIDSKRMKNLRLFNRRAYNSGKISGINKSDVLYKFEKADNEITELGLKPVSPLRSWLPNNAPYWLHMIADLIILSTCNTIYLQEDWEQSKGARIEERFAKRLGLRVLTQKEYVNTREVNEADEKKEAFVRIFLRDTKFRFKQGDKRISEFMEIARSLGVEWKNGWEEMKEEERRSYFPAYGRLYVWEGEDKKLYFAHGGGSAYFDEAEEKEVNVDSFFEVWNSLKKI